MGSVFFRLRLVWQRAIALTLVCILTLPLAACDISNFRNQSAQASRLVVGTLSDPKAFNPITESNEVTGMLFDGLLSTNGVTGELEPGLAESWEISPDQRTITYKLRKGLKWSDGVPMTVDDVVFYYNSILFNEKIPNSSVDLFRIGEKGLFPTVRQVDDRRVEFVSPEPFAPLLRFAGGSVLPKHTLEKYVTQVDGKGVPLIASIWGTDTDPKQLVGNGAYVLKSYEPGQRMMFERNPYYWKKRCPGSAIALH